MKLNEKEQIILESDNNQIVLTTHRLRYKETPSPKSDFTSIMLDKISSIEVTYHRWSIWYLILGILTTPIVIEFILIFLWWRSKSHVVFVTPDGGRSIIFETKGMKRESLEEFVDKTEEAAMNLKYNTAEVSTEV
ncbi:MAG: hypothetical protein ACI9N1_000361 [Flavobacteriales bacterium]|jgi:hypothetical protein